MQGRTDNSWGPRAIGDHGAPVSLPKLKKSYEKGTRGISWGPLLTPGPRAVPEFPNGQSAPGACAIHSVNEQQVPDRLCSCQLIVLNDLPRHC
ncbi:unnamed protein product [Staurois parvus]|uniref:Uncharacterized protein n=1 Tax=Staurois parvus TaxID=386267 RepID=A0ABN9HEV6_9NEOB|nr:unnamed protein product [Staurois parvus]